MADGEVSAYNSPEKHESWGKDDHEEDEKDTVYEVETIIGKSKLKGKAIYKVRWKGYGPSDDTWEPVENLDACQDLIEEYNEKQSQLARKRAEERRAKRAVVKTFNSAADTTATDVSTKSDSLYPPNFKNAFWKDLEAGRVNLFDNDMYSKVKKRAVPKLDQNVSEKPATGEQSKLTKRRTFSDPETKTKKSQEDRKSRSASKIHCPSHTEESTHSLSSRKIDFQSNAEECNLNEKIQHSPLFSITTDSTDSEMEIEKPALNIVIRKVPDISSDMNRKCNIDPENPQTVVKYSVVQKSPCSFKQDDHRTTSESSELSENSWTSCTWDPIAQDESHTSLLKGGKKKKQHKHRKHKTKSNSKPGRHDSSDGDRKRKMAVTSLGNLETVTSKGTSLKVPKLEPSCSVEAEVSDSCRLEPSCNVEATVTDSCRPDTETDLTSVLHTVSSETVTPEIKKEAVSEEVVEEAMGKTHNEIDISMKQEDSIVESSPHFDTPNSQCSSMTYSNDLNILDSDRSHSAGVASEPRTSFMDTPELTSRSNDFVESRVSQDQLTLMKSDMQRQDSETFDSGIASPASEKSLTLSKQGMIQPLDDLFNQNILPLMPDNEQTQNRGADPDLDIDLDEVDWDLFDKDVRLEPLTLTNGEFAKSVIMGDYELVKQAVIGDTKYDLEQPDQTGKTLLMCAVHSLYDDIAELLIEHGANIDAQTKTGETALMIACQHAEISTVNLLLDLGAKVNIQCSIGESALIIAAKRGHTQIMWLLLECGANFNQASCTGHTALTTLRVLQYRDMEGLLTSHIHRVMSEFDRQVSLTLNNTANILCSIFPAQVFNLCESDRFHVKFDYDMQPHNPGLGFLLFVGHAMFTSQEVRCRFYGPCTVQTATLNGQQLPPLTQEGNFVLAFSPLLHGKNVLTLNTVSAPDVKAKLIVCAYKAQLRGGR